MVLLLLSALVSGSEVAFFSLSAEQVNVLKTSTDESDRRLVRLLHNPKRLLATILIANNFLNVALITIATYLVWEAFAGSPDTALLQTVLLTFVTTFLIVFFGEVTPKVYATQDSLQFAHRTAPLLALAQALAYPLASLLIRLSNAVETRIERKGYTLSVDQLNHALDIATESDSTREEKDLLKGIVNFGTLSVKQIMRSRLDITAFDSDLDFHELMDRINKSGYSRVPIYRDTIDKIEGILYIKDLLAHLHEEENFAWRPLLRSSYFVPESKKIDDLLRDFQQMHVHIAIVVDEYGGTSGLVTLEDIIEEIVGEINDELDDAEDELQFTKVNANTFVFEGKTSLKDFAKVVGVDVDIFDEVRGESESLGGLLLEINAKMPRNGEKIDFDRFSFQIVSVDQKRIKKVRVQLAGATANRELP